MNVLLKVKGDTLVVSIILLIFCGFLPASGCPKVCECKWKYGKIWVICSNAKFIDVPQGLEPSTQVLDLSNNNLKILFRDAFIDRGLVNLQKVFLVNCKLRKLDDHCFRRLANLVELNLSYNSLSAVPTTVLADVPGLRELRMKRNNLVAVLPNAFEPVPDLVHLDLSFNIIKSVHEEAFSGLGHLEVLKLSGNKLTTIEGKHFNPLTSLHELDLHANLWHCDCNLRSAIRWLRVQNLALSAIPKCWKPPQVAQAFWNDVNPNKLFCIPKVTPLAPRILVTNGENVTLACKVETIDSDARVTWHVDNKPLINDSLLDADEQRFSVFEIVTMDNRVQTTVSNLTISEADFQDEGIYRCVVENEAGTAETNLTLQVSEVIREDPLVDPGDSYIAGAVVGGIVTVSLAMIFCISVLVYRKACRQAQQGDRDKIPFQEKGEFVSSATTESLTCSSEVGNVSSIAQIQTKDGVTLHSTIQHKPLYRFSDEEANLQPVSGHPSKISYLEVGDQRSSLQPESSGWKIGVTTQYPDILLRSGRSHPYCTLARRSNTICGKHHQERAPKLQKEQISRSSSCLHEGQRSVQLPRRVSSPPLEAQHTLSLEGLNVLDGLKLVRKGSTPHLGSKSCIIDDFTPGDSPVEPPGEFIEGHKHRISAQQLSRILREYSYMKEELRRLKEIEREREIEKGNERHSQLPPVVPSDLEPIGPLADPFSSSHRQTQTTSQDNSTFSSAILSSEDISPRPITPPPEFDPAAQERRGEIPLCKTQPRKTEMILIEPFSELPQTHESHYPGRKIPTSRLQSELTERNQSSHSESRYQLPIGKGHPQQTEGNPTITLAPTLDQLSNPACHTKDTGFKL